MGGCRARRAAPPPDDRRAAAAPRNLPRSQLRRPRCAGRGGVLRAARLHTGDHHDVSFHHPRVCERAMLVFRDPEMPARIGRLKELGLPVSTIASGAADGAGGTLLESPHGTPIMLLESER